MQGTDRRELTLDEDELDGLEHRRQRIERRRGHTRTLADFGFWSRLDINRLTLVAVKHEEA
jgi:hypothetical protein